MSEGRLLWAWIGALTTCAALSLALLDPPRPGRIPLAAAAALALLVAPTLFVCLHGVAVRLARPSLPLRIGAARLGVFVALAANEEAIWRRMILGEGLAVSRPFALAASSLGFAVAHRARRAAHLLTGAAFGGVYLATGSLLAAIFAHVLYNLLVAAAVDAERARAAPAAS